MIFNIIGNILLVASWVFVFFGVLGIYRFKNIYARLLTSSNIDTVAFITIIFALIFKTGFNQLSIRLIIILVFMLLTGPVSNHVIARSAYLNGIPSKEDEEIL